MDRLFRIDFYPQDWIAKTGDLTAEECGVYIQIVAMIYAHRGPIIYDADTLSRKLKGCSVRLLKSIVQRLIEKDKITIHDGKICQRRAEQELKSKRTHLELSAKGGRTKAELCSNSPRTHDELTANAARTQVENQHEINENNEIASTDTPIPVATPIATASPTAIAIERIHSTARAQDGFHKIFDEGSAIFPKLATRRSVEITKWLEAGADPDLDILPEIRRAAGKDIGSWGYFGGAIMDALTNRLTPLPKGNQNASIGKVPSKQQRLESVIRSEREKLNPQGR